jgi:hypothetical protein
MYPLTCKNSQEEKKLFAQKLLRKIKYKKWQKNLRCQETKMHVRQYFNCFNPRITALRNKNIQNNKGKERLFRFFSQVRNNTDDGILCQFTYSWEKGSGC